MTIKTCAHCCLTLPLTDFHPHYSTKDRRQHICKACDHIRRKTNKGAAQERLAGRPRPDGCEVCGGHCKGGQILHWDHKHDTGVFRGWLCENCNRALGMVRDDPALLRKLADYLEHSGPGPLTYDAWKWHSEQGPAAKKDWTETLHQGQEPGALSKGIVSS